MDITGDVVLRRHKRTNDKPLRDGGGESFCVMKWIMSQWEYLREYVWVAYGTDCMSGRDEKI